MVISSVLCWNSCVSVWCKSSERPSEVLATWVLVVRRETLKECQGSWFSWGSQIAVLVFRQQIPVETNFKAQERIGADFVWGPSGTLGEFKAILQVVGYLVCAFLHQCYTVSFVPWTGRLWAVQVKQNPQPSPLMTFIKYSFRPRTKFPSVMGLFLFLL